MTLKKEKNWAGSYLNHYFSDMNLENIGLLNILEKQYKNINRTDLKILEIGGGPTIYQLISASFLAEKIIFTDMLQSNLDEINEWKNNTSESFNWRPYFNYIHKEKAELAETVFRSKLQIEPPIKFDLKTTFSSDKFDVISSFFCLETIANTHNDFIEILKKCAKQLAENGMLMLGVMENCVEYKMDNARIHSISMSENEFKEIVLEAGMSIRYLDKVPRGVGYNGYDALMVVSLVL